MICVYKIRNIINNDCYYGSSIDVDDRWYKHKYFLKNDKHWNIHLQRAWNKYGEENFVFEIVEEALDKSNLLKREQWYLDNENCRYNISRSATGGNLGYIVNEKISLSKMGDKNPSKRIEVKEKLSKAKLGKYDGQNNPMSRTNREKRRLSNGC
jgi:group I intron endonuclease